MKLFGKRIENFPARKIGEIHPDRPITAASFWRLSYLIAEAGVVAGINQNGSFRDYFAYSPPQEEGGPSLMVSRYLDRGYEALEVRSAAHGHLISAQFQSDKGRIIGFADVFDSRGGIVMLDETLSNDDAVALADTIADRLINRVLGQKFEAVPVELAHMAA